jgi:hypothetical protein
MLRRIVLVVAAVCLVAGSREQAHGSGPFADAYNLPSGAGEWSFADVLNDPAVTWGEPVAVGSGAAAAGDVVRPLIRWPDGTLEIIPLDNESHAVAVTARPGGTGVVVVGNELIDGHWSVFVAGFEIPYPGQIAEVARFRTKGDLVASDIVARSAGGYVVTGRYVDHDRVDVLLIELTDRFEPTINTIDVSGLDQEDSASAVIIDHMDLPIIVGSTVAPTGYQPLVVRVNNPGPGLDRCWTYPMVDGQMDLMGAFDVSADEVMAVGSAWTVANPTWRSLAFRLDPSSGKRLFARSYRLGGSAEGPGAAYSVTNLPGGYAFVGSETPSGFEDGFLAQIDSVGMPVSWQDYSNGTPDEPNVDDLRSIVLGDSGFNVAGMTQSVGVKTSSAWLLNLPTTGFIPGCGDPKAYRIVETHYPWPANCLSDYQSEELWPEVDAFEVGMKEVVRDGQKTCM